MTRAIDIEYETLRPAYGFVELDTGKTYMLRPTSQGSTSKGRGEPGVAWSGAIYTDADSMPSLEALLDAKRVAYAVLERPVPTPADHAISSARSSLAQPTATASTRGLSRTRLVVASAIPAATITAGVILLFDSVAENTMTANPYTALALILGGLVLFASLLASLRSTD